MNFGKINEVLEMPNLIEVQKNSYRWFREEGLKEVFRDVSSITDYNGNLVLNFIDCRMQGAGCNLCCRTACDGDPLE